MGKQQDWSVTACVFLFLSLTSQIIHCTSQTYSSNRLDQPKRRVGSSRLNVIRPQSVTSQKEKDLIKNLPGQPAVNFKQYGGYVSVNEKAGRFLYYYFVEAIKPTNSTPLVIWFNGGPGCSSIGSGAFMELGPFRVHSDGKTLYNNPYSWNNEANLLFIETPAGVGFSYSKTQIDLDEFGQEGDKRTAEDNYIFLENWLKRFPEYKGREIYVTGESYAGHYVPQLAQLILQRNNQNFINLRGILIGNPGLDYNIELYGRYEYMLGHALIPQDYMDNYNKYCDADFNDDCIRMMRKINSKKEHLESYNIYAPKCRDSRLSSKPKECATVMEIDMCGEYYVTAYFNKKDVQEAIHANTTKTPKKWESCNDELGQAWSDDVKEASMVPVLQELMGKVRVLVYSGDLDLAVPFTSTLAVLKTMNLTDVNEWRPWFTEGEVGGFTQDYEGNFIFASVRGAGHFVPTDQPVRALTLFTSFIRNIPLPQAP